MFESPEGMTEQPVLHEREHRKREAARAVVEEYREMFARVDERIRAEPVFRPVSSHENLPHPK